jgi:subtilisin-like proprotein convertase family protein
MNTFKPLSSSHRRTVSFFALLAVLIGWPARAQFSGTYSFTNDFSAGVPPNLKLTGTAQIFNGYLALTFNSPGQIGSAFLDGPPAAQGVESFRADFKAALFGGSTPPADGYSFNFAPAAATPTNSAVGEQGVTNGLAILFDTFDNSGEAPSIGVVWNGGLVSRVFTQVSSSPGVTVATNALRNVSINLDADGTLDLIYGTNTVFTNLATSYRPIYGGRWVLAARTGGSTDNHWIDDLSINATLTPPPPVLTNGFCLNLGGGYVEVTNDLAYDALPMSITAWIRTAAAGQGIQTIASRFDFSTGFELAIINGQISGYYNGVGSVLGGSVYGGEVGDGQWHHVALTVTTNSVKGYVDGVSIPSGTADVPAPSASTVPLRIGANNSAVNPFFGQIDDVSFWNSELSASAVVSNALRNIPTNTPGLVSYHRFNEGIGTTANDATGHGHTGALIGTGGWLTQPLPIVRPGARSHLELAGGWALVQPNPALNAYPLTVTAWIRTTNVSPGARGIVNKYDHGSLNGYSLHVTDGNLYGWYFRNGNSNVAGANGVPGGFVADGAWHHVAFTIDPSGGRVYVDGALRGSLPWTGTPGATTSPEALRIGNYPIFPGDGSFRGNIDEVTIWNTNLNQATIQARMHVPLAGSEVGLLAYYRLNEGTGFTSADATGHGYNAGFVGEVFWEVEDTPLRIVNANSALSFEGGFVEVPHHTNFNVMPISLSAWIRTTNANTRILYKRVGSATDDNGYELSIQNGVVWAGYARDGFNFFFPAFGITVNDGRWHHVLFALDDNDGTIYVDGQQTFGSTWAFDRFPTTSTEPFRIGSASFRGEIDEVSVWNFHLSPFEGLGTPTVASLWDQRLNGNEPGLVAYYRLDETTGTNIVDATTHGHNGRWVNGITRVTSGAQLVDHSQIRGRLIAGLGGATNTLVTAVLGPVEGPGLIPIPDNGVVESTNVINGLGNIGVAKVRVNISHPFRGDLELTLIHPDGTEVRLKDANVNDDGEDWIAAYSTTDGTGTALAPLLGKTLGGAWRLRARDAFGDDVGLLNSWSLGLGPTPVFSDDAGDYAFSNLFAGTFTVQPERSGFVFNPQTQTVPSASSGVNFELVSGFIAGRVTGAGGAGLGGVTVGSISIGFTTTTDTNGYYRLAPVGPGNYTLTATLAGHGLTPLELGTFLGNSNANFAAVSFPVAGRVVDLTSNGVPGVTVSAGAQSAVTDADGNYVISQVPPGARTITPSRGTAIFSPTNRSVTVGPALAGVNFTLQSAPPTITDIPNRVIGRNGTTGAIRFDVDDTETRAGLLTLTATSSDTSIVPVDNIVFGGVGNARTVTIKPQTNVSGVLTITITVADETGLTASDSFVLRVNTAPLAGVGGALAFNGTNYLDALAAIGNKGNFSVEFWAYAPSNAGPGTMVVQGSGANVFSVATDAAGMIQISGVWNTGVPFPFGGWHHVAVVKEISNTRLYLDGVLSASRGSTLPFPASSPRLFMGRNLASTANWRGSLDEVRVWDRARTVEEIATNRNTRITGAEPSLTALWRLDERTGAAALDTSSNALHGFSVGTPLPAHTQAGVLFSHYVTTEDTPIHDVLQAFDPDNDTLMFTLVTPPLRGTVTLTDTNTGAFTYTPNANASGEDRFTFFVGDGYAETDISLLTINIIPDTNAPSISFVGSQIIAEDTTLGPIAFTVDDIENVASNLTMSATSSNPSLVPATNIVFSGSESNRTFTLLPATNANGTVTISLIVSDGKLTATNSFVLTITPVNDAPFVIHTFTNQVVRRGQATPAQPFVIGDVDNSVDTLSASGFANPPLPVVAVTVGGSGPDRTVSVVGSPTFSGLTTINIVVHDGALGTIPTFTVLVNEPPSIAAIPNQSTLRSTPTKPIAINLFDVDNSPVQLTLAATSSNPLIVADNGFTFGGSGANRTLVITPLSGQVGAVTISIRASDGTFSSTNNFTLFVEEVADYVFTELPNLPGASGSVAVDINEQGQAVGEVFFGFSPRAVRWDASSTEPQVAQLFPDGGFAFAINNAGDIVGLRAGVNYLYRNNTFTTPLGGSAVAGVGVNDAGAIVGLGTTINSQYYFDGTTLTNLLNIFYAAVAPDASRPLSMNDRGDIFGPSTDRTRAIVWQMNTDGTRTLRDLGTFGGTLISQAGINNAGDVCINVLSNGNFFPLVYNFRRNVLVTNLLPTLIALVPAGVTGSYFAQGINGSGEVVGSISTNAPGGGSSRHTGFLYSDRRAVSLQNFASPSVMQLTDGYAINEAGDIVGRGVKPGGNLYAFLLRRQSLVGRPIAPPLAAINPATQRAYGAPQVQAIDGTPLEQAATATLWSDLEQRLYFVRPMAARITWLTTSDLADTNAPPSVVRTMRAVFPADAQIHIAGAPVEVEPLTESSPYRAVAMSYTTVPSAVYDQGTKALTLNQPGYTVIRYLIAPETALGSSPDPGTHSNYFQIVRSVAWNDPAFLVNNAAVVGTKVSDPRGASVATNSPKSGWVVNAIAPYDGVGGDASYDRATLTGPIIPVNKDTASANDDLAVVFYKRNPVIGSLWPDLPVRFNISWPVGATKLVIANSEGSGALPPAQFPDKRIYVQSNANLPGYNPNEEHAFFAPTSSGEGVFALRNDLNSDATSRNFVLLKYHNPTNGEWAMKPYEVVLTDAEHSFAFNGKAGQEILPPYPLSLLPVCAETTVVSGEAFKDHRGKLHAVKGPTPGDPNPHVVVRYFYPLQPTFFYDLNRDGTNDVALGGCVGWSDIPVGGTTPAPVHVTYSIQWPTNAPALQIGETLLNPKGGLPGVKNWASAQVVFDTLNPNGDMPLSAAARLYDPISTRTLKLTNVAGINASYQFPGEIALETRGSKQVFSGLPYYLRSRLSYEPLNKSLSWSGVINDNVLGEPLLLINVMSTTERERIKQLSGEAKFHSIIDALYDLTRNPNRVDANGDGAPDQELLIGFTTEYVAHVTNGVPPNVTATLQSFVGTRPTGPNIAVIETNIVLENLGDLPKALTAGLPVASAAGQTNYIVLAENNDPALGALPVTLQVIRVEGGPFRGDLKILFPDNVFDEQLTLRHSSDFGGDPDRLQFEWWYHTDDADFDPVALPVVNPANGQVTDSRGWRLYKPATAGQNSITLGDGAETSLFTLVDNWFVVRYRGYVVGGETNWSPWVGDPSSAADTRAAFAPGWIKRVIEGINPFEARTTNFHDNASVTYASMLIQAGERYEGPIALNPSGANLNSVGLIEAYTTVLDRGRSLSIDGLPPIDSDPANNALLLAASRIADLYMLLGNEAFSDAQDPTIGFFSDSLEFGTVATSIFAYQNQLDSLLEEELGLLRGRDDSASGVGARPVYNRLLWNFTGAEGEVAYERVYNVGDVNLDGVINEFDAKVLFPQGHGDAWGHYLTAATTYYELLRHPRFTWIPRTENVLVAGTAVRVDFLDERKFAAIAAQKAKAGAEIVDLTYRAKYVDDPEGQYQGYKDTRADRAWGVTEWSRRVGQGAYFDWLVANAVLPSTDPNTNHVGIQKIDRQTVLELDEVIGHHREVQAQLDKVDKGLNPIGLAKGVVPFDIDPSLLLPSSGVQAQGHFEQVYNRAVQAMNNTVTMWNQANSLTEALRRQQDTVDEFTANVSDQERDFKSRLIEVFGYPYAGDIGAGKTYPSGYDGPDIYHYQFVAATELTGRQPSPRGFTTGYFKPFKDGDAPPSFYFGGDLFTTNVASGPFLAVNYPLATGDWAFTAPASYGSRRAPGEIQLAISDLLQEETRLKQALNNYDGLIQQIEDLSQLLQSRVALSNRVITLLTGNRTGQSTLNSQITAAQDAQLGLRRISSIISRVSEAVVQGIPQDLQDFLFPVDEISRAIIGFTSIGVSEALEVGADIAEGQQNRFEKTKEQTQLQTDIDVEVASQDFEVQQMAAELRQLLRSEAPMRLETFNQAELVRQSFDRYLAALGTGQRLIQERTIFRQRTAGLAQQNRYKDIAFRIFRNDALQKYRAQFDLATRYVFLAASAYDYELNFLGNDTRGARDFFTDIIRERSLGVMVDGIPITGRSGLSDPLARLKQNFEVLSPRFGLNNPQQETARFSLRKELFRIRDDSDAQWRKLLADAVVPNLWQVPEFRRYCRPFAPEPAGPQPGLVLRFPTTVTFGLNFFEHALGGGDTAYDPSLFSTKINAVGVWFSDYNGAGLATAPRVYMFPAGMDVMRSPTGNTLATREWRIIDQVVPVPFPIGASDLDDPTWIPINDSLAESFAQIRRYSSFRAYHDLGVYDDTQSTKDSRLVGRSVWNTDWVLIIPGGTLLNNPDQGLEQFIDSVSDILISLQSYSYAGD